MPGRPAIYSPPNVLKTSDADNEEIVMTIYTAFICIDYACK